MNSWVRWLFWASMAATLGIVGARLLPVSYGEAEQETVASPQSDVEPPPMEFRESADRNLAPSIATPPTVQQAVGNTPHSLDPYAWIHVPWFGSNAPQAGTFASTEIGDVTGDSLDDLVVLAHVVSTDAISEILVYAQTPDHTLAPPKRYPIMMGTAHATAMGDFNEDGIQDVLVTGQNDYTVLLSDPTTGFRAIARPIYQPIEVAQIVPALVMQVDDDQHLDLVFYLSRTHAGSSSPTAETHSRLLILYGDGLGGFERSYSFQTFGAAARDMEKPVSLASGDLDHDGRQDVAVRVRQCDYWKQLCKELVRAYLNDGSKLAPGFDVNATMQTGANYSSMDYIAIGDFNGDGRDDLAGSPGSMDMRLWVSYQTQLGGFGGTALAYPSEPMGTSLAVADLDGNGTQDLAVGHDGWDRLTYHLQSYGLLSSAHLRYFQSGQAPGISQTGVSIGDLNGDGCKDAAVAISYWGVRLLRGAGCSLVAPPLVVCRTDDVVQTSMQAAGGIAGSGRLGPPGHSLRSMPSHQPRWVTASSTLQR